MAKSEQVLAKMDTLPQPHPPPDAWWLNGSEPQLNSFNDVVTRVKVLEKLSRESKICPITVSDSDDEDELPQPSRVRHLTPRLVPLEPKLIKPFATIRFDAQAQTGSLAEGILSSQFTRSPNISSHSNHLSSPKACTSKTLSPADAFAALAALAALPGSQKLRELHKRKPGDDQASDHCHLKPKHSRLLFITSCQDNEEQSSSTLYSHQSSDSSDSEDFVINDTELDPDSLNGPSDHSSSESFVAVNHVDFQAPSLDNLPAHIRETYLKEDNALMDLPLKPLAREAFLNRMAQSVNLNKFVKKEWFDDAFVENMKSFSFFKDEEVDKRFSELYMRCTNLSHYMRTVIRSFWDAYLFKFFYIPANLVYSNPTRSDLTQIPGYKTFHQMLNNHVLRGSTVAFRWSSNASKMSSEFLNPEFQNAVNSDVSRTIDFRSPPVMAQLIQRAMQVLKKRKYPMSHYSQVPDDVQDKLAHLQYFPNDQLNDLFRQIITSAKSVRTAVHETAHIFWSADYLKKHYLPVERQGRSSKLPPVEGYAYFFDLWNEIFNFRNDEARKKCITTYVAALNHNMTFGEKHNRLSQIGTF